MTIIGIRTAPKPNYVPLDISLPLKFFKGSISVSMNFEQHPTGSITINSIPESQINAFESVYSVVGLPLVLFAETRRPIFFEVAAFAKTEDAIFIDQTTAIKAYDVVISLRGGHERKLQEGYRVKKPIIKSTTKIFGLNGNRNAVTNTNFILPSELPNNDGDNNTNAFDISSKIRRNKVNLSDFAELIGVDYEGYSYAIEIPKDAGSSFRLNFAESLQRNLRLNQQIVDFHEPTIKTRDYRAGQVWKILNQDILYSIELSKQQPYEYRDTVLAGKDGLPFLSPSQRRRRTLEQLLGGEQERKEPEKVVLEEGDENPTQPPPDVKELISIDMNFDFSGPRKTYKKTTTLNGQPIEEELTTYGLAYLAQEIRNVEAEEADADPDTPALKSTNPGNYWTVIEYLKTTYEYKPSNVSIRIKARDKETNSVLPVKYLDGLSPTSFRSRYLTSITTTGFKLSRFQQEQFDEFGSNSNGFDSRWLNDTIADVNENELQIDKDFAAAALKAISFRKVPYYSRTQYKLIPLTEYYDDSDPIPFTTQEVERKDLGYAGTGTVVTALPDPSFVYPMLVAEEYVLTQSFAQMDHPQNIIIRDERSTVQNDDELSDQEKEDDLKDLKLLPWLTTGEDTYQATIRKILPSANTSSKRVGKNREVETDLYIEYQYSASNQDAKFQYSLQEGVFRTVAGRPPSATNFQYEFESRNDGDEDDTDPFNYEYLIDSTRDPFIASVESLQYETDDLDEGLAAAKADLELNNFLNVYEDNINLAWFYPEIRPGDYLEFVDDISKGQVRVKSVSFQIDYQDHVNGIPHRTCSGTSITAGRFEDKTITNRRQRKDDNDDGFDVESTVRGEDTLGRSIYKPLRSRRNPSGVDLE